MQHLPPETIRLLSSSQTISSVVSVVKELVENSLDANATNIEVKLENNGFDKIEVRDNGDGIKAIDVPVMGLKHYTSKISQHEDLETLQTYGFRGEALCCICGVSGIIITTKTADDEVSTQYTLDNIGHVVSQKPSHMGQGTTVTVLRLFKNIPVRKQFYSTAKKCKEELKKIQDLLMAYSIIKPELRIVFTHNKAIVWQKAKVSDHKKALLTVLGTAVMVSMVPFQHHEQEPEIFLSGFLPKSGSNSSLTSLTSPDRSFIFVNSRPVHHKEILKMIRQYYAAQSQKDSSHIRYPICFLNILVSAAFVDVNLTPDKTQIMLLNKEAILSAIEKILISIYGTLPTTMAGEPSSECANKIEQLSSDMLSDCRTIPLSETSQVTEATIPCSKTKEVSGDLGKEVNAVSNVALIESSEKSHKPGDKPFIFSKPRDATVMDICFENANNLSLSLETLKEAQKSIQIEQDTVEMSAESWSMGHGVKDSAGQIIEPVKILIPGKIGGQNQTICDKDTQQTPTDTSPSKYQSKSSSNVVQDKTGQITLYDLISNHTIRKALSPSALFMQETRLKLLAENPKTSLQDISVELEDMWKNLNEEEKKKFEEKAVKDLDRYNSQLKRVQTSHQGEKQQPKLNSVTKFVQKHKRRAPLSNQQILDKLFESQTQKKTALEPSRKTVEVPFSLSSLKTQLQQLSKSFDSGGERLQLINRLSCYNGWVIASGRKLMLLNPFRVEEALLYRRLMENHILPTQTLDTPISLSNSLLGGPQYIDRLCKMQKECSELNGVVSFTDPRLVFNGFKIQLIPGASTAEQHLHIQEMARCLPYYGVSDLQEILRAVLTKNAQRVHQCRPLKVVNYLEGEAVRLIRQLPLHLSREDIEDMLVRMQQQLEKECNTCIHGRPFIHHLADLPEPE
uniref:PMS1 homolog 1, mismatch repair system component n=1 Tax=Callorhinchus milii TaxID=7868 RepID=A0A4W3JVK8_CALMI